MKADGKMARRGRRATETVRQTRRSEEQTGGERRGDGDVTLLSKSGRRTPVRKSSFARDCYVSERTGFTH